MKSARTEEQAPTPEIAVTVVKPENVETPVLIDLVMSQTRRKFALDTEHAIAPAAMMEQPAR